MYALTVHSSVWIEAPRSRWMLGRATFTTRLSRTIMNSPTETITSVQIRWDLPGVVGVDIA